MRIVTRSGRPSVSSRVQVPLRSMSVGGPGEVRLRRFVTPSGLLARPHISHALASCLWRTLLLPGGHPSVSWRRQVAERLPGTSCIDVRRCGGGSMFLCALSASGPTRRRWNRPAEGPGRVPPYRPESRGAAKCSSPNPRGRGGGDGQSTAPTSQISGVCVVSLTSNPSHPFGHGFTVKDLRSPTRPRWETS